jgi:hypothetical protein
MIGRLLALLIAANLAWATWSQGWLQSIGLAPRQQAEPERLQRQLHPESVSIQPPQSVVTHDDRRVEPFAVPPPKLAAASASVVAVAATASSPPKPAAVSTSVVAAVTAASSSKPVAAPVSVASAAAVAAAPQASQASAFAPASGVCLQAGPFDDKQIDAVRNAAAVLPDGSWRIDAVGQSGRWMIYMGKYADADAVRAKRDELRGLGIDSGPAGATWEPGLSLGRYFSEELAQRGLTDLGRKGVRTARVVQERPDTPAYVLRLSAADPALLQRARGLRGALWDKEWHECK